MPPASPAWLELNLSGPIKCWTRNLLRKDLDSVIARLNTRKNPQPFLDEAHFRALEAERKTVQTRTEELQARRNSLSKQIGMAAGKGEDACADGRGRQHCRRTQGRRERLKPSRPTSPGA